MNKNIFLSILAVFLISVLTAQTPTIDRPVSLEINLGRSFHGTGDIPGFHLGFTYTTPVSNKLHWFVGLEGTLHDKIINRLEFQNPVTGELLNSNLNGVTGGLQVTGGIQYNFIQRTKHNFGVSLGTVLRYQATSLNDFIEIDFPAATGLPIPVRVIVNYEPHRTFAVGGLLKMHYNYTIGNKYLIGFVGGSQLDTNEDIIHYVSLNFGFRL